MLENGFADTSMARYWYLITFVGVRVPKRKSPINRLEIVRIYFAPAGGLLLWLGICAVGWVSLGNLSAERSPSDSSQGKTTQNLQQNREQVSSPQPSTPPRDNDDRATKPKQLAASEDTTPTPETRSSVARNSNDLSLRLQGRSEKPKPSVTQENTTPEPNTKPPVSLDQQREAKPKADEDDTRSPQGVVTAQTSGTSDKKAESATGDPAEPPSTATAASPIASANVSRAQLTSGIEHREPIDRVAGVFHTENKPLRRIYYFTELKGLSGRTVTHNWWHDGRLIATVKFRIGSNSWRVYSSKKLLPSMTGPWRVVVTDSQGKTLSTARFVYKSS